MKKEIIAIKNKPSYSFISIFVVVIIFTTLLFIGGLISDIPPLFTVCIVFLIIEVSSLVFTIVMIHKNRIKNNTLIYYENKKFYLPHFDLVINKDSITRVVFELQRFVISPINLNKFSLETTLKNNVGKLHITYLYDGIEYYIKLKNVINPDIVENRIKNICNI